MGLNQQSDKRIVLINQIRISAGSTAQWTPEESHRAGVDQAMAIGGSLASGLVSPIYDRF
jgi:hypothetical protein